MGGQKAVRGLGFLEQWIDGSAARSSSVNNGFEVAESGFFWQLHETCLRLFKTLLFEIHKSRNGHKYLGDGEDFLQISDDSKECLSRMFLWGEGLSGGQLDIVLQESDDLKFAVLRFISVISRTVLDTLLPLVEPDSRPEEVTELARELQTLTGKAQNIIDEGFGDTSGECCEDQDSDSDTCSTIGPTISKSVKDIEFNINCLMALLPSMERMLQYKEDQEHKFSALTKVQVSTAAGPYCQNIYDKYQTAHPQLIDRLGEANYQRHIAIRNKTALKLGTRSDDEGLARSLTAESIFVPVSIFNDSGLGTSALVTNGARTEASHSSFKTNGSEDGRSKRRVPETPQEVGSGLPFPCDICGHILKNIRNRYDWKVHVFADLQPYICTFFNCKDALLTFPTRRLWEEHEFAKHRVHTSWVCPVCPEMSSSLELWKTHLSTCHEMEPKHVKKSFIRKTTLSIESQECPLCLKRPGTTRSIFVAHVCRHLEDIALAALPNEYSSDSEDDSEDDAVEPEVSSLASAPASKKAMSKPGNGKTEVRNLGQADAKYKPRAIDVKDKDGEKIETNYKECSAPEKIVRYWQKALLIDHPSGMLQPVMALFDPSSESNFVSQELSLKHKLVERPLLRKDILTFENIGRKSTPTKYVVLKIRLPGEDAMDPDSFRVIEADLGVCSSDLILGGTILARNISNRVRHEYVCEPAHTA